MDKIYIFRNSDGLCISKRFTKQMQLSQLEVTMKVADVLLYDESQASNVASKMNSWGFKPYEVNISNSRAFIEKEDIK